MSKGLNLTPIKSDPAPETRRGKIRIPQQLIKTNWREMRVLFAEFVPFDIEWKWGGVATYRGFCERFDEIEEGMESPEYEVIFTRDGDTLSMEFKRQP